MERSSASDPDVANTFAQQQAALADRSNWDWASPSMRYTAECA